MFRVALFLHIGQLGPTTEKEDVEQRDWLGRGACGDFRARDGCGSRIHRGRLVCHLCVLVAHGQVQDPNGPCRGGTLAASLRELAHTRTLEVGDTEVDVSHGAGPPSPEVAGTQALGCSNADAPLVSAELEGRNEAP